MYRKFGIILCLILGVFWLGSQTAHAQNISEYISTGAPENWVERQSVSSEAFALSDGQKLSYRLLNYQTRVSKTDHRHYRRIVMDLQTASAVEDNGTISVNFDPSFKKVKFHHIRIINADGTRDVLNLSDGELFRTETDRDKLLFDGTLQFSLALKGLQVGDQLDYAYTSYGKNPALGEGYFIRQWQAYSIPVQHLFQRAVIDADMPIHTKLHHEAKVAVRTESNGQTIFTSSLRDVEALSNEDDQPVWYYHYPALELSYYGSWTDVGNHFAPNYRQSGQLGSELQTVVAEIKDATSEPKEQTRRALNYVQENIRYLGLEMGVGGFEPRPASLVYERRFGDCKDVTLLLLSLLNALNIEADPVLVHTTERAGFLVGQAHHWAFDHVIVRAEIDGRAYMLDATLSKQLGTLDKLEQGDYQKGLLLREGASEIIDLPQTPHEWRKDFYDEFDLVSGGDDILYTLTGHSYGADADSMYGWYLDDGRADIEKQYLEYYQDFYPSLILEKPTEIEIDEDAARFTIKAYYRIVDGWEKDEAANEKTTWAVPYIIRSQFPVFSGAKRSSPYSIPYPVKRRQTLAFKVGENYAFDDADLPYETDAFDYREINIFKDQLYKEIYTYETKQDSIAAKDVVEVLSFVNKTRDEFGLTIYEQINPSASAEISDKKIALILVAILLIFGLIAGGTAAFFGERATRKAKKAQAQQHT